MTPKVAIQTVAYWGPDAGADLDALLASVAVLNYPKEHLKIVVIDNPSPHGTAAHHLAPWVGCSDFPLVEIVPSPVNDGYSGGHARGWERSMAWGADYVFLINQDAFLSVTAIQTMVAFMEAHPQTAVAQSLVCEAKGEGRINTCGNRMHYLGYGLRGTDSSDPRPIFYASGAAMMVRPLMIERSGGLFDPWNFMYHEDVDLSWRARLAGFDVASVPESIAYHRYEFNRSMRLFLWMERNRIMTHLSNFRIPTLLLMLPIVAVMELGGLWFALRSRRLKDKAATYRWFLKKETWHKIVKRRRVVHSIRKRSDRDMLALSVDTLASEEVKSSVLDHVVNPVLSLYGRALRFLVRW